MIHVEFIGRLANDAETKVSKKGEKFITMRMATDEYNNGTKETAWVRVTCPPERYLNIVQYLTKGKPLQVHGTQKVTVYKNSNGDYVPSIDVMADRIDFLPLTNGKENGEQKTQETTKLLNTGILSAPSDPIPSAEVEAEAVSTPIDDLPF